MCAGGGRLALAPRGFKRLAELIEELVVADVGDELRATEHDPPHPERDDQADRFVFGGLASGEADEYLIRAANRSLVSLELIVATLERRPVVGEAGEAAWFLFGKRSAALGLARIGELSDLCALSGQVREKDEEVTTFACLVGAKFGRHLDDATGDLYESLVGDALGAGDRGRGTLGHGLSPGM